MAQPVRGLTADRVRANLAEIREEVDRAAGGRAVEILAAVKYVPLEDLGVLAEAGVTAVAENRAQELERKAAAWPHAAFTWDFIGQLQSRKVRTIAPLVRRIHSVGSDSARDALARLGPTGVEAYVQVNIAGEEGKAGIRPEDLARFADGMTPAPSGLMVMPPLADAAEDSRRWFAAARELADAHGLAGLSMGTTQDFAVAVEEGATVVRIGGRLFR